MAFFQHEYDQGAAASWPTPNPANGSVPEVFTHAYHFPSLVSGIQPHDSVLANHVLINEVQTKGNDRVELYNPTGASADISGWQVVCEFDSLNYIIPAATSLSAGAYLLVDLPSGSCSNDGDVASLYDARSGLVDQVGFGTRGGAPIAWNLRSLQRTPNGTDSYDDARDWNVRDAAPTFLAPNDAPEVLLGSSVLINEMDNYPVSGNDKVEFYNPAGSPISVDQFGISDGDAFDLLDNAGPISALAGGWLVLEETVNWNASLDFASADVAYLFREDGVRVDQIGWVGESEDDTFQRLPDGAGPNDGYDWVSSGGGVTWFDLPSTLGGTNTIADLGITKDAPAIITPGAVLTYTLSYNNAGPAPAQTVLISDTLPAGVTYLSDDSGLACPACLPGASGDLVWQAGSLASGAADTFHLWVQVDGGLGAGALLVNTAGIAASTDDNQAANNTSQTTTSVSTIDLSAGIDGRLFSAPGELLSYTVDVVNVGVTPAQNVMITDTLPLSTTYSGDDSGFSPANPSPGVFVWSIGDLLTDTTFTFNLTVTLDVSLPPGIALTYSLVVTTTTPNDNPANNATQFTTWVVTPIHDIQGAAHLSPYAGQSVLTGGVVTVVRPSGFYLQDPGADGDDATSEAIYVYTGGSPGRVEGEAVLVAGSVSEYRSGGSSSTNLTLTELTGPSVSLLSTGNPLPAPVVIGTSGRIPPAQIIEDDASGSVEDSGVFDPVQDGIDFYESLECMLVQVNDALVVAATNPFGEIAVVGDHGAHAGLLSPRDSLVIQAGDFNPERILVDDTIIANEPQVTTGARFNAPIVGVMDYTFGNFKLFNIDPLDVTDNSLPQETTALTGAPGYITVASFNLENLDPNPNDGDDDTPRFAALADEIVNNLYAPDILAVQEIQDNSGGMDDGVVAADQTYQTLIDAILTAGGPVYEYRDIAPLNNQDGGQPGANIRVGFLFRTDRGLAFIDRPGGDATTPVTPTLGALGVELSFSPGRVDPNNAAFTDSRKPLAGEFSYNGHKLIVVVNHLNSKGGDDPLFGRYQPPSLVSEIQRIQQAVVLNQFVGSVLALDAQASVVVLGDLNDFQFSAPLQTLAGSELQILLYRLAPEERYSYLYDGNAQTIDHILVTAALSDTVEYDMVHLNSEYLDTVRPTDHDPALARLNLQPPQVSISKGVTPTVDLPLGGVVTYTIDLSNPDQAAAQGLVLTDILPLEIAFGGWVQDNSAALNGGTIQWMGDLPGTSSLSFVFTATVEVDYGLYGSVITNTSEFTSTSSGAGSASAASQVVGGPELSIAKTVALSHVPVIPGDPITYTLWLTNSGPSTALNVTISDTLPAGITGTQVITTVNLPPHSSYQLIVPASVEVDYSLYGEMITNTASYTSSNAGSGSASASFTLANGPSIEIAKTVTLLHDPALLGDPLTYTLWLTNSGDADALQVHLQDMLPPGMLGADVDIHLDIPAQSVQQVVITGTLAHNPGLYGHTILNTAVYDSLNAGSGLARASFDVIQQPVLLIEKRVTLPGSQVRQGEVVTYTLLVTNSGPAEAEAVHILDILSAELVGNDVDITTTIQAGQSFQLVFTATVASDAPPGAVIANTASYQHSTDSGSAQVFFTLQGEHRMLLPVIFR